MVKSIRYVTDAWINKGSGIPVFEQDLRSFGPDLFIVNEDSHSPAKEKLCTELGINYLVLKRIPEDGLPTRSTTSIRSSNQCQKKRRAKTLAVSITFGSSRKVGRNITSVRELARPNRNLGRTGCHRYLHAGLECFGIFNN